jgi:hypothetical protein
VKFKDCCILNVAARLVHGGRCQLAPGRTCHPRPGSASAPSRIRDRTVQADRVRAVHRPARRQRLSGARILVKVTI